MEKEQKWFSAYVKQIINLTFGFEPEVVVTFTSTATVQITLDGTPYQKSEMMGKGGQHFQSIKMLLRAFARKNGFFAYLYIKPDTQKNYAANIQESDEYTETE